MTLATNGIVSGNAAARFMSDESEVELAAALLHEASMLAHPPISNFKVGAAALGTSGAYYLGANYEIAGQALGFTVHAEQSAIANAWMAGEEGIERIVVTAAPCGHCRQFLNELVSADRLIVQTPRMTAKLSQLLPSAFGPTDLGVTTGLMGKERHPLSANASDELALEALDAAAKSYAPYSGAFAGVAVRTKGGQITAGSYAENAAFNPSLPPLQVVLSQMNLRGLKADEIAEAVLVQVGSAHTAATRLVLAAVSSAPLRVVEAVKSSPSVPS
jgi:cytidine deaminase